MSSVYDRSSLRQVRLLQRSRQSRQLAVSCLERNEYGHAFAHFIAALTIEPSLTNNLFDSFLLTLEKHALELESKGKWNDALANFEQASRFFPNNENIMHGLGSTLYRMGFVKEAAVYFQRACIENPLFSPSLYCLDNIKGALVERWHFLMLNDKARNTAYSQAINRAMKLGHKCVLDIGAGTGILSMMSVDAGAKEVYACECNEIMFKVLQDVTTENEKFHSIHLIQGLSTDLSIPLHISERVDLVVTETFDAGLLGENVLMSLKHAWEQLLCEQGTHTCSKTLLKKVKSHNSLLPYSNYIEAINGQDGCHDSDFGVETSCENMLRKVIPHCATVWAVPVECERIRNYTRMNSMAQVMGFSKFLVTAAYSDADPYTTERVSCLPGGYKCLSSPKAILEVNFNDPKEIDELLTGRSIITSFECKQGTVDAFFLWFQLHLDEEVTISSAPNSDGCWEQAVFYVLPKHLQGASYVIYNGDILTSTFLCQDHITLQNVESSKNQLTLMPKVFLDCNLIYQVNAVTTNLVVQSKLWSTIALRKSSVVLDCSPFPVLGLLTLSRGAKYLIVLDSENKDEILEFIQAAQISGAKICFKSSNDLHPCVMKADLLVHQPIEMCGLLRKQILEKIAYLRTTCLKETAVVIPGKIEIFAVLLHSPTLWQQIELVSNENTAGYKISSHLNLYKTSIHQDIELSTLPHEKLSNEIKLCDIDFNCNLRQLQSLIDLEGSVDIPVTKSGVISAIPFWFKQTYDTDCVLDTLDPNTLWRQAASIPDRQIKVMVGDTVVVQWTCKNSCFHVMVDVVK